MTALTATGLVIETYEDLVAAIDADCRTEFGKALKLGDGSVMGRFNRIIANRTASVWEAIEAVYNSQDPNGAIGAALSALCALTGTVGPKAATASTVTLTLTGTPATAVTAGSQGSNSGGDAFGTDADATIAALTAWATATAYVLGDRVTSGGDAWECSVAGTSAGSGSLDSTGLSPGDPLVDNTATWIYLGPGTGAVDVASTCTETGPVTALAYDIVTIETPVSGWDGVINLLDADEGTDLETDEDLRVRRETELAAAGTGPADAIRADILALTGVTACTVFVNDTDFTDADGVPPHAVEVLVRGGTDQEIIDQLWDSVPAGTATHGTTSGSATDDEGVSHTVKFSRPTEIEIYVDVELTKNAAYPADGDTKVKEAIVDYGDAQDTGKDVVSTALIGAVFCDVLGVEDIPVMDIGLSADPSTSTTLTITSRQLAVFDTSRITVVST